MLKDGHDWWAQAPLQDTLFPKAAYYRLTHDGRHKVFTCWVCGHRHLAEDQVQGTAESACSWCWTGAFGDDPAVM